ncbi:hypothetical protein O7626_30325 [Micromonospora sp. WMMD1102]|uniref:hypothetical protein n=1 Tax=Micromonospora sp. WMMD1102 TaxID=3016105 RepID=UPI0024155C03|nr:hypothetical protein [Micromonospora sp. WMMD1102]MDG4790168.1 hypothetical protein [Micromonospora sp. WMMD1102]
MILPANAANRVLAVLVKGSGYTSMSHLATAINDLGRQKYGLNLGYDYKSIKRWLLGSDCERPDLVAEVLSNAWGTDITPALIWPHTRNGAAPLPAHRHPFVADRTLKELATFVRRDMLCQDASPTSMVPVIAGPEFADAIVRWYDTAAIGISASDTKGTQRTDTSAVEGVERATTRLMASEAEFGGMLTRDAAVGQLKSAVDLINASTYDDTTGNRLLAAVATLAGTVGHMSYDSGLDGPAQHYFTFALQAARESTDERAPLTAVRILADMARQLRSLDQPHAAMRLIDLAVSILPGQHTAVRAMLWNLKANVLASTATSGLSEVRGLIDLAANLRDESRDEAQPSWQRDIFPDVTEAGLHREATGAYLRLATTNPTHARELARSAETEALQSLAASDPTRRRERAHSQIDLAQARFLLGDTEQARTDAEEAARLTSLVPGSARLRVRLREMLIAERMEPPQ